MAQDKKYQSRLKEKFHPIEEGDSTESGSQGQGGDIEFRDFITSQSQTRDDLLPPAEKQRLLAVHKEIHELRVKKQKEMRELRQDIKEGKKQARGWNHGLMGGGGATGSYKPNPKLADKAQFSGVDKQVIALPSDNMAVTNEEKRDEHELQFQHQLQLRYTPDNTPRLTPKNYK